MEGGKGSGNYWPGFVDALTNVVIAMVFVIVVLAIALAFAAQLMGKKLADEMIKKYVETAAQTAAKNAASEDTKPTIENNIQNVKRIPVKGKEEPLGTIGGKVKGSADYLQLEFAASALSLDDQALDQLKQSINSLKAKSSVSAAQLVATGPAMHLSENQRVAYIRVMNVRNFLLDQGYTADRISVRIDTEKPAQTPVVSVAIVTQP